MKTYQFKTNINCSGCIEKVTPYLKGIHGIADWKVDTANPAKILSVESEGEDDSTENEIIAAIQAAGYRIEPVPTHPAS